MSAKAHGRRYHRGGVRRAMLYILPTYAVLFVFIILPIFFAFYLSFTKWNLLGRIELIGVSNYKALVRSDEFCKALVTSAAHTSITVPLCMALSLFLALLLN